MTDTLTPLFLLTCASHGEPIDRVTESFHGSSSSSTYAANARTHRHTRIRTYLLPAAAEPVTLVHLVGAPMQLITPLMIVISCYRNCSRRSRLAEELLAHTHTLHTLFTLCVQCVLWDLSPQCGFNKRG